MINNQEIDLVILAGGTGSRISKYTKKIPKPLIKINGVHFLKYLINFYSKFFFKKIYILAGYRGEKFKKFHNSYSNLIPIELIVEKKKLGTGGAVYQLKRKIKNKFILINGDSFLNYDVKKFFTNKLSDKEVGKILLVKNNNYKSNKKLSNLKVNTQGTITRNGSLMNAGVYLFDKKIFNFLKLKKISLEDNILPKLIDEKLIKGFYSNNQILDIGTYTNLKKAKKFLKENTNKYSVFFDRDGVINIDNKYVYKIKDFIFRKNAIAALKLLNKRNINIFIVTNQAGIARGFYSEKHFFKLSNHIKALLDKKNIYINDIEFCPFHPEGKINKYRKTSSFRKPGNGMIKKIKKNWGLKNSNTYMLGDKPSDSLAAKKSGIYFEYVEKDILKQVKKINKKLKFSNYS
jgi:D-glycero-D-manno-heptose 1,7-bisphosphate phosphatase